MDLFVCGPQSEICKCECSADIKVNKITLITDGPTPRPSCEHKWDGEPFQDKDERGHVRMESSSCSRCGMLSVDHDMWALP